MHWLPNMHQWSLIQYKTSLIFCQFASCVIRSLGGSSIRSIASCVFLAFFVNGILHFWAPIERFAALTLYTLFRDSTSGSEVKVHKIRYLCYTWAPLHANQLVHCLFTFVAGMIHASRGIATSLIHVCFPCWPGSHFPYSLRATTFRGRW